MAVRCSLHFKACHKHLLQTLHMYGYFAQGYIRATAAQQHMESIARLDLMNLLAGELFAMAQVATSQQ